MNWYHFFTQKFFPNQSREWLGCYYLWIFIVYHIVIWIFDRSVCLFYLIRPPSVCLSLVIEGKRSPKETCYRIDYEYFLCLKVWDNDGIGCVDALIGMLQTQLSKYIISEWPSFTKRVYHQAVALPAWNFANSFRRNDQTGFLYLIYLSVKLKYVCFILLLILFLILVESLFIEIVHLAPTCNLSLSITDNSMTWYWKIRT